ncbi:MAG: asparagine synthase [Cenarchaeum sp. SB0665_bin_23]|nr:asparagine synthase [Cenarchaeum sp. SB0667_bin_13]MXY38104.1 asparagine synthase [Cenarchaeum sp. SB0664_bin_35]MXY61591.1 asparagine synthase [Cenarchaeum sp. SB0665_bin_23]MXZ93974.1 asparagine synthase [Cenarchaeum sp. SB0666_bin_15]MYB47023.1 asparagine synthase [Cenarchaeum sp. SB0662_bin_33]MYC79482.1 asparagine synthase [Cenarchaeum sp. SB0661_bin_35]MYD58240.1 asparagine synthase [Cenarchaeum sp. SB0678_bin_8]MYG33446.1 asparagine synthase [Cenarchaeum sp. SB0677_bin_16]MYI51208
MECMQELYNAIQQACLDTEADTISLSGGLDSTIIAYMTRNRRMQAISVIAEEFVSTDLTYAQMVSRDLNMQLHLMTPTLTEILEGARQTINILGNFNDIEIRNSLVMYFAIKEAKRCKIEGIITGDGADEIFAGYNFLLRTQRLADEIRRLRSIMHFTSHKIGRFMGVRVESPFLDGAVTDVASRIEAKEMVGLHKGNVMGKMILRRTFKGLLPPSILWREKAPMQDGAGTVGLTDLLESLISDFQFETKISRILREDGIQIRTKESLFYYEQYRNRFGAPPAGESDSHTCPYCKFTVGESRFCRMCGAFPV